MKTISFWLFILAFTAVAARAQDAELTERISKVEGYVQDLQAAQLDQKKQIQALEKEIADLRDKLNQPAANNYAGADDLKKLAEQVQDLAKKQQSDNDQIVKTLDKLGKISAVPAVGHKSPPSVTATASTENPTPGANVPQKGYPYTIHSGDNLSAIAKAYTDQGHKVTVKQILDANQGLDPNKLTVGKTIFIPAPAQ